MPKGGKAKAEVHKEKYWITITFYLNELIIKLMIYKLKFHMYFEFQYVEYSFDPHQVWCATFLFVTKVFVLFLGCECSPPFVAPAIGLKFVQTNWCLGAMDLAKTKPSQLQIQLQLQLQLQWDTRSGTASFGRVCSALRLRSLLDPIYQGRADVVHWTTIDISCGEKFSGIQRLLC